MGLGSGPNERITRLQQAVGPVNVSRGDVLESPQPLIAVTCSRLGHDVQLHRHVCQFLTRCLLDCRQRRAVLMIATGSAIESWATRAAELFAVPVVKLSVDPHDQLADIVVCSQRGERLSHDAAIIAVADRVDAVYVRRRGIVESCLRTRVEQRCDASTRVAVSSTPQCAAAGLIAAGAIGWFHSATRSAGHLPNHAEAQPSQPDRFDGADGHPDHRCPESEAWIRTDGQWLIHCTRQRDGAWPGETERQYRDSVLLGDDSSARRGALDALIRIVKSGQLVAGAKATMMKYPVVCFSSLPLVELLQRRCFRPQLGRWDYEPYGIAIRLSRAESMGIRPVIYGDPKDRALLAEEDCFRFHPIGKKYDWRQEREWRSSGSVNLAELNQADVRVFAEDLSRVRQALQGCRWPVTLVPRLPTLPTRDVTNRGKPV